MYKNTKSLALLGGVSLLAITAFSGCAIMDEDTCLATNWYQQGENDGRQGSDSELLGEYISACSKYITVDTASYNEGRYAGAVSFCTPQNGYDKGRAGWSLTDICDGLEANARDNFNAYYQRGYNVYESEQQLKKLDQYIADIRTILNWGAHDVGLMHDYEYFIRLRPTLVSYISTAKNAGMNGYYDMYSFTQALTNDVPDKWALEGLERKVKAINTADREIDRIRSNSCYDSDTKACRKKVSCLFDAEDKVNSQLRRYLESSNHGAFNVSVPRC